MQIRLLFEWGNEYDWIIIPTLMVGFRKNEFSYHYLYYLSGIGFAILFLKLKVQILFFKKIK